ncbi:MAG: phage holin family protein [Limnothrix sp.]
MLGSLLTLLATALSLLVVDIIFPGVNLASFPAALVAGVVIGLVNAFIKPALSILALPVNFLTLGVFSVVVNGLCFWLASLVTPGFQVSGLIAFLAAPFIMSVSSTLLGNYFGEKFPELTVEESAK